MSGAVCDRRSCCPHACQERSHCFCLQQPLWAGREGMHVGPEAPAVAESADGTRVVGVRPALVEDVTVGNRLLLWVRGHLPAPASLVSSVGQGMGPGFLGRGGRAQLRPPLVGCWANPGAVTSQGSVGTILLPQPPTAEGERGGTPPAP